MRSKVIRALALAMLLSGVGMIAAQQTDSPYRGKHSGGSSGTPKQKAAPAKSKLEEMLGEALKNNPDIRVAAAKLAEADAELNRTRLQVIQKVVMHHHAILTQKAVVEVAQKKYDRVKALGRDRVVDSQMVDEVSAELTVAKAKLEELEAQMPALLGKPPSDEYMHYYGQAKLLFEEAIRVSPQTRRTAIEVAESEKAHKAAGALAEKIRKALQTPIKVGFKDMALQPILDELTKKVGGISFRIVNVYPHSGIDLRFEEALPLSAVLQALADEFQCCFYVREYGILASAPNFAPPGAMKIEEFLRQKPADELRRPTRDGKNPPAANVEGLVKSVDASGLIKIGIGSDAGLTKGHTLELFRLNPSSPSESKYLGSIRILEAEAHQSVAQAVGRLAGTPKVGDRVASRILGK